VSDGGGFVWVKSGRGVVWLQDDDVGKESGEGRRSRRESQALGTSEDRATDPEILQRNNDKGNVRSSALYNESLSARCHKMNAECYKGILIIGCSPTS
jgi:hypothetical protein